MLLYIYLSVYNYSLSKFCKFGGITVNLEEKRAQIKLAILFLHGKHEVYRRMEYNESLDQGEESQWYDQCGKLIEKLDSYKASVTFLSDNNVVQKQKFNQLLKLLKTELEFEEQKLRMLTKSDGVFYEASFNQSKTKIYNFDKSGEGKDITKEKWNGL